MQIHESTRVPHFPLAGVDELPRELRHVPDVGRAASPRELALLVNLLALFGFGFIR